jgi:hypothetical protein
MERDEILRRLRNLRKKYRCGATVTARYAKEQRHLDGQLSWEFQGVSRGYREVANEIDELLLEIASPCKSGSATTVAHERKSTK